MQKYSQEDISYINNSVNVVDYAMQYLDLKQLFNEEYWTNCPFHKDDVTPSLSFNKEKNVFYCLGCGVGGSTIQFVMKYHKLSFPKAIEYIIKYASLDIIPKKHSKILDFLYKSNFKNKEKKVVKRKFLSSDIMEKYTKEPVKEWLQEGIKQDVLDKYNVRYDKKGNRIVFPVRNSNGNIIAIKGRTLYTNFKDLGLVKYIYYQKIITNDFLFGLYENKNSIKSKKKCIVVEAEKGVMKLSSWGFDNVVALSSKNITDEQSSLLLSLKCDLVFVFDKDVLRRDVIRKIKGLSLFTNVFYIYDKDNLLEDKDSPYDKTLEIWNTLYTKYKYKI